MNKLIVKRRTLVLACLYSLMFCYSWVSTAWADQTGWKYQPGSEDSEQLTDLSNN